MGQGLMTINSWVLGIVLLLNLLFLPYFAFILATTVAALFARRAKRGDPTGTSSTFLIVVPAYDEEAGIAETVRSCLALEYPRERFEVVVIADNCTDSTAAIARSEGATVVERLDPSKKSKGYAIEYLIDRFQQEGRLRGVDALVIIDADSTASSNLLRGFAGMLERGHEWIQCYYTVANPDASWRTKLMTYAFGMFNGVTPLGQFALGLSAGFR